MSKPLVVIAEKDENYLATFESKFLIQFDDKIELEIISDEVYFETFFENPKTAEIVVVCEDWYSRDLHRHNIANLFVFTEEIESGSTEELSVTRIYKYTGIKEIFNELTYKSRDKLYQGEDIKKETRVISFYSAIGGSGKTSLSLGLAENLAGNHQRVLYINTESIQVFGNYLDDSTGLGTGGYRALRENANQTYENIKQFIRRKNFAYVPPFMATLDALDLSSQVFVNMVKTAKESKDYDFIIVDIEAGYSRTRTELLELSDKVIMVMLQDKMALYKTEYILKNMDFRDREKYIFICNKYEENKPNAYFESILQKQFPLHEYVENERETMLTVEQLGTLSGIQKIAYMFI